MLQQDNTPQALGYTFPPEWAEHRATWLSFPKNVDTWEDRFEKIYPAYMEFIKRIAESEKVCINAAGETQATVYSLLDKFQITTENIEVFNHPTNDSWCRDHGPAFLKHRKTEEKLIINWDYNAWGSKYPPYDADNNIPLKIAETLNLQAISPGIVMEGGSIEVNGAGTLLTSESCLLNPNRNPHLTKNEIETYLKAYYGVEQILWVKDGIVGDDTDGHIDDTTRFVNQDTVITCVEHNKTDENYKPLLENLHELSRMQLLDGKSLNIIELPMPSPVYSAGIRLPASYANFYITNKYVIVPTYRCSNDEIALDIIQTSFHNRKVIGIDSTEIIWGLGSFHCLSQQEPL